MSRYFPIVITFDVTVISTTTLATFDCNPFELQSLRFYVINNHLYSDGYLYANCIYLYVIDPRYTSILLFL
ncbi:hypothetical protein EE091_01110 [Staphylococcus aureus]|nr:hypothetical protein EE091_01110 [Staphylococcus aureus]